MGDRGYISQKLSDQLAKQGVELVTKAKRNMKKKVLEPLKEFFLNKRGFIETMIGQLKGMLHVQHTRHRSPANFLVNLFAGLLAYTLTPKKPSAKFHQLPSPHMLLTSS